MTRSRRDSQYSNLRYSGNLQCSASQPRLQPGYRQLKPVYSGSFYCITITSSTPASSIFFSSPPSTFLLFRHQKVFFLCQPSISSHVPVLIPSIRSACYHRRINDGRRLRCHRRLLISTADNSTQVVTAPDSDCRLLVRPRLHHPQSSFFPLSSSPIADRGTNRACF